MRMIAADVEVEVEDDEVAVEGTGREEMVVMARSMCVSASNDSLRLVPSVLGLTSCTTTFSSAPQPPLMSSRTTAIPPCEPRWVREESD